MNSQYLGGFALAFVLSLLFTPIVRWLSLRFGAVDKPDSRKIHKLPVPRLGGVAVYLAFVITFLLYFDLNRQFVGLLAGVSTLFIVGIIDDLKGLSAWVKLSWQIVAAVIILAGGIGIIFLSNPLGGLISLDGWRIPIELGPLSFNILPIANLVSVIWIVGLINTLNFLDGLDGLASGVAIIVGLVLFVMAFTPAVNDASVGLLAIILVGALLGFLPFNFFPSSIFLGDSGAYTIGALLATFSIYAGSKIAVGAIVLGVAILDAIWTVSRRLLRGKSPFTADRGHLHHRLLDSGMLSHRQVVVLLYIITIAIAATLLFGNVASALLLGSLMLVATVSVMRIREQKSAGR